MMNTTSYHLSKLSQLSNMLVGINFTHRSGLCSVRQLTPIRIKGLNFGATLLYDRPSKIKEKFVDELKEMLERPTS